MEPETSSLGSQQQSQLSFLEKVSEICSQGAISLGGDEASSSIDVCIIYKGQTYTESVSKEALVNSPNQVLTSCNEILDKIISTNDPLPDPPKMTDRLDAIKYAAFGIPKSIFTGP